VYIGVGYKKAPFIDGCGDNILGMRLGRDGPELSPIGIGAWQAGFRSWGGGYTREDVVDAYRYAFENGVNFIDTAEVYGMGLSEEIVGEAIRGYDVVVATKVAGFRTSPRDVEKAALRSRSRLGVDVIDLYQVHWPPAGIGMAPICRVLRTLEGLVDRGVIRYIGVSNFDRPLLERAMECMSRHEIISNQIQYSMVYRRVENGFKDYMEERGVLLIAYSPLGKGVLAGKTSVDNMARRLDPVFREASKDANLQDILARLSSKYGVSKAAIALRWLVEKGTLPIPGVKRRSHVDSILEAMEMRLSPNDMALLDRATQRYVDGEYRNPFPRWVPNILVRLVTVVTGGV